MIPPPLHSHSFKLTLHTSNATPPTAKEAFDLITAHRIEGAIPAQVVQAQTLGGTLRALSVHAAEGQTKRRDPDAPRRPKRREYRVMLNRLVELVQFENQISFTEFAEVVEQAKRLIEK
jgi:hypothetical protein